MMAASAPMFLCILLVITSLNYNHIKAQPTYESGENSADLWRKIEMFETQLKVVRDEAKVEISALKSALETLQSSGGGKSSTYVHWGRTTCGVHGSTPVYKGYMAGPKYSDPGSGTNYLCLTENPTWEYSSTDTQATYGEIYGVEYRMNRVNWPLKADNVSPGNIHSQDAPCAVCETVGRGAAVMIPGTQVCPQGWTQEYTGYIMASEFRTGWKRTEYICVDDTPEGIDGGSAAVDDGSRLYYTRAKCGNLPCGPYRNNREITCVVCAK